MGIVTLCVHRKGNGVLFLMDVCVDILSSSDEPSHFVVNHVTALVIIPFCMFKFFGSAFVS